MDAALDNKKKQQKTSIIILQIPSERSEREKKQQLHFVSFSPNSRVNR